MPNSRYRNGDAFEKRVARDLTDNGYLVWQTRGSKGAADLIALKPRQIVLAQVKSGAHPMTGTEWNALLTMAHSLGAVALIVDRVGTRYEIRYRRLTGYHVPHSQEWVWRAWTPDEVATVRT